MCANLPNPALDHTLDWEHGNMRKRTETLMSHPCKVKGHFYVSGQLYDTTCKNRQTAPFSHHVTGVTPAICCDTYQERTSVFSSQWHIQIWPNQREAAKHVYYQGVVLKIWFGLFTKLKQSPKNGSNKELTALACVEHVCCIHWTLSQWERMCCFQKDKKKRIISSFRYNEHSELPFNLQFHCFAIRTQVKFEAQSPSYAKSTFSFPQLRVDFIYHVWCG